MERAAAEQQQSETSSAAGRWESARESEVSAAVASLRTGDAGTLRQVEPLARLLPVDRFRAVVEKLNERRLSSPVRNDAGLFVYLLGVEVDTLRRERAIVDAERAVAEPAEPTGIEALKRRDPAQYVRAMLSSGALDLEAFLAEYVDDPGERARLRRIAR